MQRRHPRSPYSSLLPPALPRLLIIFCLFLRPTMPFKYLPTIVISTILLNRLEMCWKICHHLNSMVNRQGEGSLLENFSSHSHVKPKKKQKLIDFTYSEFRRSRFTVWSYAEDRLPPVKIRAHSEPSPSSANGCKNCPNTTSCSSIATSKNNLCNKQKRLFVIKL